MCLLREQIQMQAAKTAGLKQSECYGSKFRIGHEKASRARARAFRPAAHTQPSHSRAPALQRLVFRLIFRLVLSWPAVACRQKRQLLPMARGLIL